MEQNVLKIVNNYLNIYIYSYLQNVLKIVNNIYSYLETSCGQSYNL